MPVIPGLAFSSRPAMTLQQALALVVCSRHWGKREPNFTFLCERDPPLCLISFEACAATRNKQAN